MALVFASNEASESGLKYDDRTGVAYEFPGARYRKLVQPGERFVYYRGRRRSDGTRQRQVYFGTGVVGKIAPSMRAGCLVCEVLDFHEFVEPVPFRRTDGSHLEPEGQRRGYFQPGVRIIPEEVFEDILWSAERLVSTPPPALDRAPYAAPVYASSEGIRAVERFAVEMTMRRLEQLYPDEPIVELPPSNPGFDLRIGDPNRIVRFVEVKGTRQHAVAFFLTEGERRFSIEHGDRYLLSVVTGIDLEYGNYNIMLHQGPVTRSTFRLTPVQWAVSVQARSD